MDLKDYVYDFQIALFSPNFKFMKLYYLFLIHRPVKDIRNSKYQNIYTEYIIITRI